MAVAVKAGRFGEANYFRRHIKDFQELVSASEDKECEIADGIAQEDGFNDTSYRRSRNWALTERTLSMWMTS